MILHSYIASAIPISHCRSCEWDHDGIAGEACKIARNVWFSCARHVTNLFGGATYFSTPIQAQPNPKQPPSLDVSFSESLFLFHSLLGGWYLPSHHLSFCSAVARSWALLCSVLLSRSLLSFRPVFHRGIGCLGGWLSVPRHVFHRGRWVVSGSGQAVVVLGQWVSMLNDPKCLL